MSKADTLFGLDGEVVVVTGGYGLIGSALGKGLAELGGKLAVIEPAPTEEKTRAVFGSAENIAVFAADVTIAREPARSMRMLPAGVMRGGASSARGSVGTPVRSAQAHSSDVAADLSVIGGTCARALATRSRKANFFRSE